jgi:hypothetical protein
MAEVLAPALGDTPVAVLVPGRVDGRTETGVAYQFGPPRGLPLEAAQGAPDVANGGQQGHGDDEADAGQLQQAEAVGLPGFLLAQGGQYLFELLELGLHQVEGGQVLLAAELIDYVPPGHPMAHSSCSNTGSRAAISRRLPRALKMPSADWRASLA